MRIEIGSYNAEAEEKLPPNQSDGSRIGVNYTDVIIKAIKAKLESGGKIKCKRRGLKLTLTVGDRSGEGLMRRLEHGPDPKLILVQALEEAARNAGAEFSIEDGTMYLELAEA